MRRGDARTRSLRIQRQLLFAPLTTLVANSPQLPRGCGNKSVGAVILSQ